jgi:hypothetical protein
LCYASPGVIFGFPQPIGKSAATRTADAKTAAQATLGMRNKPSQPGLTSPDPALPPPISTVFGFPRLTGTPPIATLGR